MPRRLLICLTTLAVALAGAGTAAAADGPGVTPLPSTWQKGLNVTAFWWTDLSGPRFRRWLTRASTSAHADQVTFVVTWYQPSLTSTTIRPSWGSKRLCARIGNSWRHCKTPSDASLVAAIRSARRLGMKVALRPQVDVGRSAASAQSREKIDIRGVDRKAWFRSYSGLLSHYARIARDTGAAALVVGADLTGMTNEPEDTDYWRHLIDDARSGALLGSSRGFTGEMTYAATWQEAAAEAADPKVHRFVWDDLNAIGVDAYFPLVDVSAPHDDPDLATLAAGWTRPGGPVEQLRALHAEFAKPVVFTGLGYLSRLGTSVMPQKGDAEQKAAGGGLSETAQLHPVQAAFDVWSKIAADERWFDGIWWWEWPAAGRGGHRDGSHSLEGKLAQQEICRRHLGTMASCPIPSRVP